MCGGCCSQCAVVHATSHMMAGHYSRWPVVLAALGCCWLLLGVAAGAAVTPKDQSSAEDKTSFEAAFQGMLYIYTQCETFFIICLFDLLQCMYVCELFGAGAVQCGCVYLGRIVYSLRVTFNWATVEFWVL